MSNKGNKERRGPTLGVRFTEVSVLKRCPPLERDVNCSFYREFHLPKKSLKIGEPKLDAKNGVFDSLTTVSFLYKKGCPLNELFLKALWKLVSL